MDRCEDCSRVGFGRGGRGGGEGGMTRFTSADDEIYNFMNTMYTKELHQSIPNPSSQPVQSLHRKAQ